MVGEPDRTFAEPRDGGWIAVEGGLAEDRIVATSVEANGDAVGLDRHYTGGLDESAVELLRVGGSRTP